MLVEHSHGPRGKLYMLSQDHKHLLRRDNAVSRGPASNAL